MIIVEGPDGAGKTTLVNRLSDDLSLEIGKRGVENRDELWKSTREDTYRALAGAVHGPPQIWDRLYFSEGVYCGIMGRENQFNYRDREIVECLFSLLQCPVIMCLPPLSVVLANAHAAPQMKGILGNLSLIYRRYGDIYPKPTGFIVYDYTTDRYEYILRRCKVYLEKRGTR